MEEVQKTTSYSCYPGALSLRSRELLLGLKIDKRC